MIGIAIALTILLGLLTLVSYVDRLYQELGKFLSREFQDNIDAFEQQVEPALNVSRTRASLSMAILTQLTMAPNSFLPSGIPAAQQLRSNGSERRARTNLRATSRRTPWSRRSTRNDRGYVRPEES